MSTALSRRSVPAPRRRGRPPAGAPALDRTQVVAAGEALLRDLGWSGLSMRAVASRLGVDPMALYRHVDSREALVAAIAAERCRALEGERLRFPPSATWQQRLDRVARVYLRCMNGAPELVRGLTASSDAAATVTRHWRAAVATAMTGSGASRALVRLVADTVADLVHGVALAADGGSERSLRRALTLVIAGIEAQGPRRAAPRRRP